MLLDDDRPEVAIYPDSEKIGFFANRAPGDKKLPGSLYGFVKLSAQVDDLEGEE